MVATAQCMNALARANEVRFWRKKLKLDLKAHRVLLADVLLSGATYLQGMTVRDLLLATPGIGIRKANRALRYCWMNESTRVSKTTGLSRETLLDHIARNHPNLKIGWEVKGV